MALVDDAVERIRDLIRTGQLPPGSRLPAEAVLAAQLGMSRNPMREAVKILAAARVLDVRQGDGTYVTSLTPGLLLEGLGFGVDLLQGRDLLDVLEVRRMLEPPATAAAAQRMTGTDLEEVGLHLDRMTNSAGDAEVMIVHDLAFHRRIVEATGNSTLVSVLDGLSGKTQRARLWRGHIDEGSSAQTLMEHQAIFNALRRRDSVLAYSAALMHVNTSEEWLRRMVATEEAGPVAAPEAAVIRIAEEAQGEGTGRSATTA